MHEPLAPGPRDEEHHGLLLAFFQAFSRGDLDTMTRCYHPEISFGDPVFPELEGRDRVIGMWRMLFAVGRDVRVTFRDVAASRHTGAAHWTATYRLPGSGRTVVNEVDAEFRFEDGLIVRHHDVFDFRRWCKMAYGMPAGAVLGWTPALRRQVRGRARGRLDEYLRSTSPASG
ncbi:nuclear transport factor 2 family protein [Sphaerisporangium siamense]|uniref:Ketosteroid isomerase-like protein n=1 Tax=Sphaerisporangium siamense TaxID=795645 RepID=A0A7W7DA16_9ACTN|nr:nuclear transport factor 2 family protein [Sphaerisporangium siamense]MBB4703032.1 ketosteroid isomerase-like protein [Sphaerisporangium siamense]